MEQVLTSPVRAIGRKIASSGRRCCARLSLVGTLSEFLPHCLAFRLPDAVINDAPWLDVASLALGPAHVGPWAAGRISAILFFVQPRGMMRRTEQALEPRHRRAFAAARVLLVSSGMLAWAGPAASNEFHSATEGELARLPEYCLHVEGGRNTVAGRRTSRQLELVAQIGPEFWHMHHYCWALHRVLGATQIGVSPALRRTLYTSAISDVNYVVERVPAGFVLLPEMLYRIGQYHAAVGQVANAIEAFERSRKAKPDYWPPYVETAKLEMRIGRREQARSMLQRGLEVMPGEPNIERALKQISAARSENTMARRPSDSKPK